MSRMIPARIAARYLKSRNSYSAVRAISIVSVCGMAVATAAIICVLSVFNGFREVISGRLDSVTPDVEISPAKGKVFTDADDLAARISRLPEVELALPVLSDNALLIFDSQELPVLLKGVYRAEYGKISNFKKLSIDSLSGDKEKSELTPADISVGIAATTGANTGSNLLIFAPRREGRVNMANPAASFLTDSVNIASIFQTGRSEYDENLMITDLETARELLQYDTEASAIEVKAHPGITPDRLSTLISAQLGPDYIVKDRMRQQEMNFRMISIEKWVTFLLLFFILIIASFNVLSSLSMLVLEKQKSMSVLRAIGLSRRKTGYIFFWQSIYICAIGGLSGIDAGVVLCLVQEHFGLIKLQGNPTDLIISAYPVKLVFSDLLITMLPIMAIALITALITSAFASSRSR